MQLKGGNSFRQSRKTTRRCSSLIFLASLSGLVERKVSFPIMLLARWQKLFKLICHANVPARQFIERGAVISASRGGASDYPSREALLVNNETSEALLEFVISFSLLLRKRFATKNTKKILVEGNEARVEWRRLHPHRLHLCPFIYTRGRCRGAERFIEIDLSLLLRNGKLMNSR